MGNLPSILYLSSTYLLIFASAKERQIKPSHSALSHDNAPTCLQFDLSCPIQTSSLEGLVTFETF